MKTILLPTDFSVAAKNAASYAMGFASQVGASRLVLYNAYQTPVNVDPAMPTIQLLDIEDLKASSEEGLNNFKQQLGDNNTTGLTIETLSEFNVLAENIDEICERVGADVIIMGITGKSKVEEVLIGSNTISVADNTTVPVIIVPSDCKFEPIRNIVFACDFKKVEQTTPVNPIKRVLNETGARLMVLHVEKKHNENLPAQKQVLDSLLASCSPEYHFVENDNIIEGINQFAHQANADLIITIPKRHGWFESMFRTRHTKKLAFHSHLPLMIIHD